MGWMFRGVFAKGIDTKGRASVPARFRSPIPETLYRRFIVTTALDPCLHVYPLGEWAAFMAKFDRMDAGDRGVASLRRDYTDRARLCSVDSLGRLEIPPRLRLYAGLREQVVWVGMLRVIELWSPARWAVAHAQAAGRS